MNNPQSAGVHGVNRQTFSARYDVIGNILNQLENYGDPAPPSAQRHEAREANVSDDTMASSAVMTGRGRGKIRPPRRSILGSSDAVDFESMWDTLEASLKEIHTQNASCLSFEQLYRTAYKLVLKKRGETLYERVKEFEQKWLDSAVRPEIEAALSSSLLAFCNSGCAVATTNERRVDGEKLMRVVKAAWNNHNLCMNMTTDVLMYMDRVYCKDFRRPSIFTAAMCQFRQIILQNPIQLDGDGQTNLGEILNSVILDNVRMDREGDVIERQLLKACVYMLEFLYETENENEDSKVYLTTFEPKFLEASVEFYQKEGTTLLQEADAGSFCRHAMKRADEEQDRCRSYLSTVTQPKIKKVVEDELMKKHLAQVINLPNSGVKFMLDNDRIAELDMVYDISSRVDPHKEQLKKAVQSRIVEIGAEINSAVKSAAIPSAPNGKASNEKGEADEKGASDKPISQLSVAAIKWVDDVLALQAKYDGVLKKAFQSDQGLQTAFSRSFSEFINNFDRSSEYLSLFFDENMKKGIKGKTENEVDGLLDRGIALLRYIQDKDKFERYYKKHLSKRLLMKKSVSRDAERQMISKMKLEVGNTFTSRLEHMFKDMAISEDLTTSYKEHVKSFGDPDPDRAEIEVNVLTSTMWPLESMAAARRANDTSSKCIFPSEIERIRQGFEKFYHGKHTGRQLTWQPHMGTADLRATFAQMKGVKRFRELNVSTYAMVILLLFNDVAPGKYLTCEEIQAQTNIPFNELTRNLQSLAVATKARVLIKEPMSKNIAASDKFYFNEHFQSQFQKVKIGLVTHSNRVEDQTERNETEQRIEESRKGVIEAALVRIMKQRKELAHQVLIVEVISQLKDRFIPDVNMVKTRIEGLIEREYLERIEDREPPAYRYLA